MAAIPNGGDRRHDSKQNHGNPPTGPSSDIGKGCLRRHEHADDARGLVHRFGNRRRGWSHLGRHEAPFEATSVSRRSRKFTAAQNKEGRQTYRRGLARPGRNYFANYLANYFDGVVAGAAAGVFVEGVVVFFLCRLVFFGVVVAVAGFGSS